MKKSILNLKGVEKLEKSKLIKINGGANEYFCWDSSGEFSSSIDVSGNGVHCVPVATVEPDEEPQELFPLDGLRK
ncbi:hypothetical protein ACOSP6_15470 [Tenacibaculum sp. MEBiC06402]|uniref:hypothetical protein n=1 Tax=unclassified Tenacibaculum TaxID=2635139 RepID=UPI003B9AE7E0